ncbi:MAG: 16S rRNA (guanine(527)-N(7))-methyltransferase RsmG [Dehalococcoidales bacterium]|nr:16S rRNA (guanine(527)-N(7))-methyltransferase RsmG [Dehalococcoidales bacterium]
MASISMNRLAEGAEKLGVTLDSYQLNQFEIYYLDLVDWNNRINITAITDVGEVQIKHFLDSLALVSVIKDRSNVSCRIIDVGTGAGFPGIPLKIAIPDIKMTLLEATTKKVLFLEHIVKKLAFNDIEIINGRAEEVAHKLEYREKFDIVVSRAVAELAILSELTLPFCKIGGGVIAQKKGDIQLELEQSLKAVETLGGSLTKVGKINLEGLDDERYLVVIDKIKATPEKYPRRSGMPEKKPLK